LLRKDILSHRSAVTHQLATQRRFLSRADRVRRTLRVHFSFLEDCLALVFIPPRPPLGAPRVRLVTKIPPERLASHRLPLLLLPALHHLRLALLLGVHMPDAFSDLLPQLYPIALRPPHLLLSRALASLNLHTQILARAGTPPLLLLHSTLSLLPHLSQVRLTRRHRHRHPLEGAPPLPRILGYRLLPLLFKPLQALSLSLPCLFCF
jgi:hypothetical protein